MTSTQAVAGRDDASRSASMPPQEPSPAARKSGPARSYSLIAVMLIYVLFALAGFFAAAQLSL